MPKKLPTTLDAALLQEFAQIDSALKELEAKRAPLLRRRDVLYMQIRRILFSVNNSAIQQPYLTDRIANVLHQQQPLSLAELAHCTDMSHQQASGAIGKLIQKGRVRRTSDHRFEIVPVS